MRFRFAPLCAAFLIYALLACPLPSLAESTTAPNNTEQPPQKFNYHQDPKLDEWRPVLEGLGYLFAEKTGHLLSPPDGAAIRHALSKIEVDPLLSDYDLKKNPLPVHQRMIFIGGEITLNDEKGRLYWNSSKKALNYLEVSDWLAWSKKYGEHSALERIQHLLSSQTPNEALSPEAKAQILALARHNPGKVPRGLLDAIKSGQLLSALEAQISIDKAYISLTQAFDGETSLKSRLISAANPKWTGLWVEGGTSRDPYFDTREEDFARMWKNELEGFLRKNSVGRELLATLEDEDGKVSLPAMTIRHFGINTGSGHGNDIAIYSPYHDKMVYNRTPLIGAILQGLPKETPQETITALQNQLEQSDAAVMDYIMQNPSTFEATMKLVGETTAHELAHARQWRRNKYAVEVYRGTVPNGNVLEGEQEAFLVGARFLHEELKADPARKVSAASMGMYRKLLQGFGGFRGAISAHYLSSYPSEAASLKTLQEIQKERVGTARRLMGETVYSYLDQGLKLIGYKRGTEAMALDQNFYDKEFTRFEEEEYPTLRREGYDVLISRARASGKANEEFTLVLERNLNIFAAAYGRTEQEQEHVAAVASRAAFWVMSGESGLTIVEQYKLIGQIGNYYNRMKRPWPPGLPEVASDVSAQTVGILIDEADKNPKIRIRALKNALRIAQAYNFESLTAFIEMKLKKAKK
ncbi:MAG: hypothetical protein COB53_03710 [Elusimicrobia bacterium]|nr:MAG: hypothetical protein COB53_03710 [Elusimicrobiota bacterium]